MTMTGLRQALKAEPGRIDKESAGYREDATPDQLEKGEQCGGCVFFNYDVLDRGAHTCEVVFGGIEFEGVCDLYRPSVAREDPEAPMEQGTDDNGRMVGLMTLTSLRKAMTVTKERYHLLNGDSEEVLKTLPAGSVHCVVTSPSYWGPKMQVGTGELGGEDQVRSYIQKLTAVFGETRRVLSDSGSLWIVLGDGAHDNFQLSVPRLLQEALVADGWHLQKARRWDRGRSRPDTILHLTKGADFYFNPGIPNLPGSFRMVGTAEEGSRFAQFPIELSEMAIEFSCPPDGVVLDTFVGTGTSMVAALKLGRQAVGIDIDKGELDIASGRLLLMKAGPPSPGLVPESGDPQHPYRWVKPDGQRGGQGEQEEPKWWEKYKGTPTPEEQADLDRYSSDKERGAADSTQKISELDEAAKAAHPHDAERNFLNALNAEIEDAGKAHSEAFDSKDPDVGRMSSYVEGLKEEHRNRHYMYIQRRKGRRPIMERMIDDGGMVTLRKMMKAETMVAKAGSPPHPGLVPQSGDPQHPVRWIRPKGGDPVPAADGSPPDMDRAAARREHADISARLEDAKARNDRSAMEALVEFKRRLEAQMPELKVQQSWSNSETEAMSSKLSSHPHFQKIVTNPDRTPAQKESALKDWARSNSPLLDSDEVDHSFDNVDWGELVANHSSPDAERKEAIAGIKEEARWKARAANQERDKVQARTRVQDDYANRTRDRR